MIPWITSHFVNPALLGGLALIAVPIIIWLLSRLRFKSVEWAAQTFLLRALKRSQKRLRLENLLLLLIRCLVIACFVLALARPRGQAIIASTEDARRNVVIVIDTSYSTGYQIGSDAQQTVHEREKRAASEILRQLRPVDRVNVIAFDEDARKLYLSPRTMDPKTRDEILYDLNTLPEVQVSARGTNYASIFHLLPEVLRRFDAGSGGEPPLPDAQPSPKSVFLLTDDQRAGLLTAVDPLARAKPEDPRKNAPAPGMLRDPGIRGLAEDVRKLGASFHVVDCGADEPKNAGVVSLETREPIVGVNLPCYLECAVRNWGTLSPARGSRGEALNGLTLEYFIDGADAPVKAVSLDLAPEETKQLEPLRYVFHEKGPHRVIARLKSDALQIDNERALVVDVREAVRVLLVDGEPKAEKWESETDFLKKALDPFGDAAAGKDLIQPIVIEEPALPVGALRDYDLIVLANVVSLPDDHLAAIEQYAKEGGAVVFAMGGLVDREHYNEKLWRRGAGVFPCKLGEIRGAALSERSGDRDPNASEWVFALADPEHPVLRVFADEEMKPHLKLPSIFRHFDAADLTVQNEKGGAAGLATVPLKFVPRPKDAATSEKDEAQQIADGAPALVEKRFGRGRSVAYMTTVDAAWSNAVVFDTFYVVFWRELALELARTSRPRRNLAIGERYERVIGTAEYAPTVEVLEPDGVKSSSRPEAIEGREQFRIGYPPSADARVEKEAPPRGTNGAPAPDAGGCEKPGIYEVKLTGGAGDSVPAPPDYFAVRIDPNEGDVAKLDISDWHEQLPGLDAKAATPEVLADAFHSAGQGSQENELWPQVMALCVGLLALESVLAALFGRRRQ